MSAVRAATALALWGAAHAGGTASPDEVLSALAGCGPTAGVRAADPATAARTRLPGPGEASASAMALLQLFRTGGRPRLLLPVPGDVRGLPPRSAALVPALDAGAAVVLPRAPLAVIPENGHWRVFALTEPATPPTVTGDLLDVERDLDAAIRQATARLTSLDVARGGQDARSRIAAHMRDAVTPMPPGSARGLRHASALLAKVISLEALLQVAAGQPTAAVSRYELAAVDDALRPLMAAVRAGRLAAVESAIDELCGAGPVPAERSLRSEARD
jgi:hypothetical protein